MDTAKKKSPKRKAATRKTKKARVGKRPKVQATATAIAVAPPKRAARVKVAEVWERRPGESDRAFAAFQAYIGIEPTRRSMVAAADSVGVDLGEKRRKSGRGPAMWEKWSKTWHWKIRCRQYDDHLFEVELDERDRVTRTKVAEHLTRIMDINEELYDKIKQMLKMPLTKQTVEQPVTSADGKTTTQKITITPVGWSLRDLTHMIETWDKAQRLALGDPTERIESNEREERRVEIVMADPEMRRILEAVAEKSSAIMDADIN